MPFSISQKSLERLEWSAILDRIAEFAATPGGRERLAEPFALFADSPEDVRERLAEVTEARAILATGDRPPLSGTAPVAPALHRAGVGGVLAARELLELQATLAALRSSARFLHLRREQAPRIAARSREIPDGTALENRIENALLPSGEVRDEASPSLAEARRETRRHAAEIQSRIEGYIQDPNVVSHLSDRYYTVRNDRYVLPVRADSRTGVRGIVHDASGSGTTLFIEPEALVELNNRLKRAEMEIERETLRVLRELSAAAAAAEDDVLMGLAILEDLDLVFARAHFAEAIGAAAPEVGDAGVLRLPQLRHPLLPAVGSVPNDVRLGEGFHVLVISGPNAGGKTVAMKAVGLAVLCARAGVPVAAERGVRVDLFDHVDADIGDEQDLRESLSTFSAHLGHLARALREASERSLVLLDEIGVGTDPGEGAALAQAVLEALADSGARVVTTTHYNLLKEMAEVDPRFANASVEFDPDTLAPTYRLHMGHAGSSSATAVAARMGLRPDVIRRANDLLERDDRQLDRMLSELAANRAALEREQRGAQRLRSESEATRDEYRVKLERLQERRDKLYDSLRADLERGFRDAHARIAGVIRDLQRGGTARDAAHARERLETLEARTRAEAEAAGVSPRGAPEPEEPIDWRFAQPGDRVRIAGGGSGEILALPDRRGRVALRVAGARVLVSAERVGRAEPASADEPPPRHAPRISLQTAAGYGGGDEPPGSAERCDLRGLRVDEVEERLVQALDRAATGGRARLVIVHGLGTGALRAAVQRLLRNSPYVSSFEPAAPEEGGDGATIACLG